MQSEDPSALRCPAPPVPTTHPSINLSPTLTISLAHQHSAFLWLASHASPSPPPILSFSPRVWCNVWGWSHPKGRTGRKAASSADRSAWRIQTNSRSTRSTAALVLFPSTKPLQHHPPTFCSSETKTGLLTANSPDRSLMSHRTLNRAGFILWQFSACFLRGGNKAEE